MTAAEFITILVNAAGLIGLAIAFGRARIHLYELSGENKAAIVKNETTANESKAIAQKTATEATAFVVSQVKIVSDKYDGLTTENVRLNGLLIELRSENDGLKANVVLLTAQVTAAVRETAVQSEQIKGLEKTALSAAAVDEAKTEVIKNQNKTLDAQNETIRFLNALASKAVAEKTQSSAESTVDAEEVKKKTETPASEGC